MKSITKITAIAAVIAGGMTPLPASAWRADMLETVCLAGIQVNAALEELDQMPEPTEALLQGQCLGAMSAYRDMLGDLCSRKRAGHLAGMTNVIVSRDVSQIDHEAIMYEFLAFMDQKDAPEDVDNWHASDAILIATMRNDTEADYCPDESIE
ncbi:hypothetical protein [Roseivivax marinus]|uniref:hypothetical protein n=1 Tax=Roseivivax marinus TaxID=1379903 RepID=UPI00273D4DC1|nr:hypothetical protein [Roseivivax marinus]